MSGYVDASMHLTSCREETIYVGGCQDPVAKRRPDDMYQTNMRAIIALKVTDRDAPYSRDGICIQCF